MLEAAILIGLAAWRLASLISSEEGPFNVFGKFREKLIPESGQLSALQVQIIKAFECMWCMTVWMSLFCAILWFIYPWTVVVLAAMAIAVLTDQLIVRGSK